MVWTIVCLILVVIAVSVILALVKENFKMEAQTSKLVDQLVKILCFVVLVVVVVMVIMWILSILGVTIPPIRLP